MSSSTHEGSDSSMLLSSAAYKLLASHLWKITNLEHLVDRADIVKLTAGCESLAAEEANTELKEKKTSLIKQIEILINILADSVISGLRGRGRKEEKKYRGDSGRRLLLYLCRKRLEGRKARKT
jgi:hypothetical protein